MKLLSPIRWARNAAVITLAFWLAGAGCLLGCEFTAAAASDGHHSSSHAKALLVVEGDVCSSTENHSCCKKKASSHSARSTAPSQEIYQPDSALPKFNESSTNGMEACPFAISRALSVAKARDGQASVTVTFFQALPDHTAREQKQALSALSPLPNRGHTYLYCCSFLI